MPLVYLARAIRIHRVMHVVRQDLGALGGRRHTRSAPSTDVLDAKRRQERTGVIRSWTLEEGEQCLSPEYVKSARALERQSRG
jgi:hypothetical protein